VKTERFIGVESLRMTMLEYVMLRWQLHGTCKEILIALDNYKNGENQYRMTQNACYYYNYEQYYQLVRFNSTKKWYGGDPERIVTA